MRVCACVCVRASECANTDPAPTTFHLLSPSRRVTGNKKYTDEFVFTLENATSTTCKFYGVSQVASTFPPGLLLLPCVCAVIATQCRCGAVCDTDTPPLAVSFSSVLGVPSNQV